MTKNNGTSGSHSANTVSSPRDAIDETDATEEPNSTP